MRERDIERKLVEGVRKAGGKAYKWVSPGNDGVPDRLIVWPGGRVSFVELKTEVGHLSGRQKIQIKTLAQMGHEVWVLWGAEDVEKYLKGGGGDAVYTAHLSAEGYHFYQRA